MLHPGYGPPQSHSQSPPAVRSLTPRFEASVASPSPIQRRILPDRAVTVDSIEDAYVQFILYCNPGVPLDVNTSTLREAFQTPPKSGGKSFNTFHLFQLIGRLETKELKTWAELALKLGVAPPDQEKGESAQKIQQYAVRLKRWMHSMHLDAFFDYILERPSTYWTDLPSASPPLNESERDGVAAEDDMALRALMPQLKPRRGKRKGGDDDGTTSPMIDEVTTAATARPEHGGDLWSAQPDSRGTHYYYPSSAMTPSLPQPPNAPWTNSDIVQTPMTAYPHSAITPSTRGAFWGDSSEPKSAITPSKSRSMARRHGAKVVSSAWRSGASSTGKTRGRPPNRGNIPDGLFSSFPSNNSPPTKVTILNPECEIPPLSAAPHSAISHAALSPLGPRLPLVTSVPPPPRTSPPTPAALPNRSMTLPPTPDQSIPPRPAKRSRLSLQVPERVGGEVRLATPPPPFVVINGQPQAQIPDNGPPVTLASIRPESTASTPRTDGVDRTSIPAMLSKAWNPHTWSQNSAAAPLHKPLHFQNTDDRTNLDELEVYFVHEILNGTWTNTEGVAIPPCGIDEAWAIGRTIIENVLKGAASKEAFLINMAALAGGKLLHAANFLKITKNEDTDRTQYVCHWELQLGDITGTFSMQETVMHNRWKREPVENSLDDPASDEADGAEIDWQKKYNDLMAVVRTKDEQLHALRAKVMDALKDPVKLRSRPK